MANTDDPANCPAFGPTASGPQIYGSRSGRVF